MIKKFRTTTFWSAAAYPIAAFLLALILTACGAKPADIPPTKPPEATVTPTTLWSLTPTALPGSDQNPSATSAAPTEAANLAGDVETYGDEQAGLALDYPAGWFLEDAALQGAGESAVYTVSLFSWDYTSVTPSKDLNTLPEGETKIDITVFNQGAATLAEAVHVMKTQDSGTPVTFTKEENWILDNGQEAVYLESEGVMGLVGTMITLVNGKTVYVSGYGDLTPFKAVALSLRNE